MALLWMDGFDHYDNSGADMSVKLAKSYNTVNNGSSFTTSFGRFGGYAIRCATYKGSTTSFSKTITPNVGTTFLILGFNFKVNNLFSYQPFYICPAGFGATSSAPYLVNKGICINGGNIYYAATATPVVTGIVDGTWHHVEIRIPLSVSGSNKFEIYYDGATVVSSSTYNWGWTNSLLLGLGDIGYTASYNGYLFDDLYVMDDTGSTNNTRIGTELYVPRIETQFPVDDITNNFTPSYTPITSVTYGFENLTISSTAEAILSGISTSLGFTNLSSVGTQLTYFRIDNTTGTGSSKSFTLRCSGTAGGVPTTSIEFSCIASTFSFWYKDQSIPDSVTFSITINGVQTFIATTTTYQQYTVTLDPNVVNVIKLAATSSANRFIYLDDFAVTYTSKNAAQALYKVPETSAYLQSTTNGNKLIGNISNLKTINDVKAVGFCPVASESITATTSSYKLIANNGGSDTEIGATQSVTGTTTARSTQFFNVNPLTSAAWTASGFNAIKAGVINKT